MSKILVTGSGGFIGKNLVRIARERGHEIVEFDLRNKDILNPKKISQAIKDCDSVIHLAAVVCHQKRFGSALYENYKTNVEGFLNVIELAHQNGIKRFLYASSSAVYGKYGHLTGPFKETQKIIYSEEENHYAKSKMIDEMIAASYHTEFGMDCIGIRIMNAYGIFELEKRDNTCAVGTLIRKQLRGEILELFNKGKQAKDFIYVDDCANIILDLLEKAPNGVYNVGTGELTSVGDVAKILGGKVTYIKNPHTYFPMRVSGDMTKTFAIVGKRKMLTVEQGIAKTIKYYKKVGLPKPRKML